MSKILRHIKQSSNQLIKKTLTDKTSMRLSRLELKSDNTIKWKAIRYIVKKVVPLWVKSFDFASYKSNGNVLRHLYIKTSIRRT